MSYSISVKEIMSYGIRTVEATQTLAEVGRVLQRIGHEGYPIVRDGLLVGLLTSRDLNRALAHEQDHLTLGDIMLGNVVSLMPNDSLEHALYLMQYSGWGQVPVLEGEKLIGIVTRSDVIHALVAHPSNDFRTLSLDDLTQASASIFIGLDARPSGNTQTNQIVIANQGRGDGSNTTVIGNASTVSTRIAGTATSLFAISGDTMRITGTRTPASNAAGTAGDFTFGTDGGTTYLYYCIASGNWGRVALTTGY